MCQHCNYDELLRGGGLEPNANRLQVMAVIGSRKAPVSAPQIFKALTRDRPVNRVTIYRILERLVDKGLVERLGGAGRGVFYGLAPSENHPAHPHFYCQCCGAMYCLGPLSPGVDVRGLAGSLAGEIRTVEVRLSGICRECLLRRKEQPPQGESAGGRRHRAPSASSRPSPGPSAAASAGGGKDV
jgi:Fur family ferric uptake transcriptional regulator